MASSSNLPDTADLVSTYFPLTPSAELILRVPISARSQRLLIYVSKDFLSRVSVVFRDMLELGAGQEDLAGPAYAKRPRVSASEDVSEGAAVAVSDRDGSNDDQDASWGDLPVLDLPEMGHAFSPFLRLYSDDPANMPELEASGSYRRLLDIYDVAAKYEGHLALQLIDVVLR